jgi:hypothetical protein
VPRSANTHTIQGNEIITCAELFRQTKLCDSCILHGKHPAIARVVVGLFLFLRRARLPPLPQGGT